MNYILVCLALFASVCQAQEYGYIENFRVTTSGVGFISLAWDFVDSADYPLHKYSLTIDDDLKSEFKCSSASCDRIIEDLESCLEHTFDLIPILYDEDLSDVEGALATTTGYTKDELPGAVSNIDVTADTDLGTTLQWKRPLLNSKCVDVYEVCFRLDGHSDSLCVESNTTEVTVEDLSACGVYHVMVTPVTPSNERGPSVEHVFTSHDGVPGVPQDVVVGLITKDTIQLLWNNPTKNLLCLSRYLITIGEDHVTVLNPSFVKRPGEYDNEFTFDPLMPCTDYVIDVCSANHAELTSEKVVRNASTEETVPLQPPSVVVIPNGDNGLLVTWGDNENDRCAGKHVICWNDGVHPVETCQETGGDDGGLEIVDLLPCTNYDVVVSVQSPNGTFTSNFTTNSSYTDDSKPGPVKDLRVTEVDVDQLTISFGPPDIDPQCVKEIVTRVIDEENRSLKRSSTNSRYDETINGLEACTNYRIQVSTLSPSGLESDLREVTNTTLAALPSEPQALDMTKATETSISLQWYQPFTNPRCVTNYRLSWGDEEVVVNSGSTFKVVHTVDGLTKCTEYTFTLTSVSSVGDSASVSQTFKTAC